MSQSLAITTLSDSEPDEGSHVKKPKPKSRASSKPKAKPSPDLPTTPKAIAAPKKPKAVAAPTAAPTADKPEVKPEEVKPKSKGMPRKPKAKPTDVPIDIAPVAKVKAKPEPKPMSGMPDKAEGSADAAEEPASKRPKPGQYDIMLYKTRHIGAVKSRDTGHQILSVLFAKSPALLRFKLTLTKSICKPQNCNSCVLETVLINSAQLTKSMWVCQVSHKYAHVDEIEPLVKELREQLNQGKSLDDVKTLLGFMKKELAERMADRSSRPDTISKVS